jgi:hypothetical protein
LAAWSFLLLRLFGVRASAAWAFLLFFLFSFLSCALRGSCLLLACWWWPALLLACLFLLFSPPVALAGVFFLLAVLALARGFSWLWFPCAGRRLCLLVGAAVCCARGAACLVGSGSGLGGLGLSWASLPLPSCPFSPPFRAGAPRSLPSRRFPRILHRFRSVVSVALCCCSEGLSQQPSMIDPLSVLIKSWGTDQPCCSKTLITHPGRSASV